MESSITYSAAVQDVVPELLCNDEEVENAIIARRRLWGNNFSVDQLEPTSIGELLRRAVPVACQQPRAADPRKHEGN